ncbi:DUF3080 family protein [Billgrantia gudaonensis]|uniref:DUF3080 domain-containing protein n=1 Tax=Billgrantia gudaonensis TaxID=376427 RepID=A0A1G9DG56_9GAMM|nr:DUF3080 family protein [Halomonas gudaonensis]SDK62886.1 Protein of unknown function [Halomonas gudaonensis]
MVATLSLTVRWRRLGAVALVILLGLAGCGGSGEGDAMLRDYQRQLAEALDLPAPEPEPPGNIGAFPERQARLFEVSETREGLLDVYALRECHITNLVAARNNQLGRVAPPSQRWIYELKLWRRLDACRDSEVAERLAEDDRARLERITRRKTRQLPLVSWNSLFDSEEWTGNFSRASSALEPSDTDPLDAQLEALRWLRRATLNQFEPDWTPESSTLEGHLKALRARPLTAELLRALLLAEQRLSEANALLVHRLDDSDACASLDEPGPSLKSRFQDRPARQWLSRLEMLAERWLTAVDALMASHVSPPDAVAEYRHRWLSLDNPVAPLPAYRSALAAHGRHWQRLAERCS